MAEITEPYCRPGGRVVYGADENMSQWLNHHIPGGFMHTEDVQAFGIMSGQGEDAKICAAVAWGRFNGRNIEATFAATSPHWQSRGVLREIFDYPFHHCGVARVTTLIAASNVESIAFNVRLGFEFEARITSAAYDGSDLIVMRMFKEQCRWIDGGHYG